MTDGLLLLNRAVRTWSCSDERPNCRKGDSRHDLTVDAAGVPPKSTAVMLATMADYTSLRAIVEQCGMSMLPVQPGFPGAEVYTRTVIQISKATGSSQLRGPDEKGYYK